MRGTITLVRRAGMAAACAALAGCGLVGGADEAPSPSVVDSVGPAFISERDLKSLISPDDMTEGFEMEEYFSIVGFPAMAEYTLGVDNIGVIEPAGCADLVTANSLVVEADAGSYTSDTVTYLFDVGGVGEAATDPSMMVLARLFETPEAAAAYVDYIGELAKTCADGITETYTDGTVWATPHISSSMETKGYPDVLPARTLAFFYDTSSIPTTEVFIQYQNAVVAVADVQSQTSIFVAPNDLHQLMQIMAVRILGLG